MEAPRNVASRSFTLTRPSPPEGRVFFLPLACEARLR